MKITEDYLELGPAYGRDYSTAKQVRDAFLSGKDFIMLSIQYGGGSAYCSVRDFAPGTQVNLRYGQRRKVEVVEVMG